MAAASVGGSALLLGAVEETPAGRPELPLKTTKTDKQTQDQNTIRNGNATPQQLDCLNLVFLPHTAYTAFTASLTLKIFA